MRSRPDRRRHCRYPVHAPFTLRCGDQTIEGFTRNLSYTGALVQSEGEMPPVGVECHVTLQFLHGEVTARGKVSRLLAGERSFALDLEHVDTNGELLLVVLLMAGSGADSD